MIHTKQCVKMLLSGKQRDFHGYKNYYTVFCRVSCVLLMIHLLNRIKFKMLKNLHRVTYINSGIKTGLLSLFLKLHFWWLIINMVTSIPFQPKQTRVYRNPRCILCSIINGRKRHEFPFLWNQCSRKGLRLVVLVISEVANITKLQS